MQNANKFETQFVRFEIKDGVLFVTYKKGVTITLDVAKEIVKQRKEFTAGKLFPILVNDEGLVSVDKDARDYFSNEGTDGLSAGAFVIKSVYSSFFFNFYLKITNPKVPAKTFTDEQKAAQWLQQYKFRETEKIS